MKLLLNEKTLNAYMQRAINEEMDEIGGSRYRKQSQRMITGKGWGNQRRDSTNGWGAAANSAIDVNADAESDTPQTLVGMIMKMEQGLQAVEQMAGITSPTGNLAASVTGAKGVKDSLLAAINALTQIAHRLNKVERTSGSNTIMESAGDYMDATVGGNAAIGVGKAAGEKTTAAQNLATRQAAYNKALNRFDAKPTNLNLNRGIGKEKAFIAAQNAAKTEQQAIYKAAQEYSKVLQSSGRQLSKGGQVIGNTPEAIIKHYTNPNGAFDYKRFVSSIERNAPVQLKNNAELKNAVSGLNSVKPTGGFWAGQARNVQKGIEGVRKGSQTIKGAGEYGRYVSTLAKGAGKGTGVARAAGAAKTTGQVLKGAGQIVKGVGQISQIPMLLLTIADEAARQAAQGRQRNIVRTYNAAAVLARRMGNIFQDISDQTGGGQEQEVVTEINVSRGKRSFGSIEQGMQALSQEMRRIGGATQGSTVNGQDLVFDIPQGIDLNTPEGVKAFQEWVNTIQDANGNALITDNEGQPLVPDGKWGPKTNAVYDKIAQMIRQSGPVNEGLVTERRDIETALANLERVAGATGSGGNAYSSISAMSGGADASRLQNAQNIKNVIRTYPPVLNQYLNVLADAGAEVSGIQPLNVDTRPHRNYSIKELKAIDSRIQELLQIAQNTQTPEGEEGERQGGNLIIRGTLPPKPVRRPSPNPTPKPTGPEEPKRDFNRDFGLERITPGDNLTAQAETDSYLEYSPFDNDPYKLKSYGIIPNNKSGRITKREIKEKIKTAEAEGKLTHDQATELLRNLRMDYKNGVGQVYQNSDGSLATTTRTADKRARDLGLQTSKIEQPAWVNENKKTRKNKLNEQQFKRLVKQIIRESLR